MANNTGLLPQFTTTNKDFTLLQSSWAAILNALLRRPANNSIIIPNVSLITGANVINHRLAKKLTGWSVVRLRASATIYDTQDSNTSPELTLQLTSSANVVADILVF